MPRGFVNTEIPCHSQGLRSLNMLRTVKPRFPKLRPCEENWVGRTNDTRNMIVCILIINKLEHIYHFIIPINAHNVKKRRVIKTY